MTRTATPAAAPEISVRPASHADRGRLDALWREVDDLHAELEPGYFRRSEGPARPASFFDAALDSATETILVGEIRGDIAGLVHVQIYDTPGSTVLVPRRRGYVEDLIVAARHRRRGVGRRLMQAAVDWAAARGATELVLTVWEGNRAALRFYDALGYQVLSRVLKRDIG